MENNESKPKTMVEDDEIKNTISTNKSLQKDYRYIEEFKKLNKLSKVSFFSKMTAFLTGSKVKSLDDSSLILDGFGLLNIEDDLKSPEYQNNEIFKNFKIENFIKDVNYNIESKGLKNYSSIIDLCSYVDNYDFVLDSFNELHLNIYLNSIKNLGYIVLLLDMPSMSKLNAFFKLRVEKYPNVNYILKSLMISKLPMMCILYIQKFELKTPVSFTNLKINFNEFMDNNSLTMNKIGDLTFQEVYNAIKYIFSIQFYSPILKNVRCNLFSLFKTQLKFM